MAWPNHVDVGSHSGLMLRWGMSAYDPTSPLGPK
jgi:hypothetical protein